MLFYVEINSISENVKTVKFNGNKQMKHIILTPVLTRCLITFTSIAVLYTYTFMQLKGDT